MCFHDSYRDRTVAIAIFQMVACICALVFLLLSTFPSLFHLPEWMQMGDDDKTVSLVLIGLLVGTVISFLFSVLLFVGAKQGSAAKCRIWLIFTAIGLFIGVMVLLFNIMTFRIQSVISEIFGVALTGYFYSVVNSYIDELEGEIICSNGPTEIVSYGDVETNSFYRE